MTRKVRIIIKVSRYQQNKEIGILYRENSELGESFTDFKKRWKKEQKEQLPNEIN